MVGGFTCNQPAQAQECEQAQPAQANEPAPCSGVVWPRLWTVKAIECVDVDLPQTKSERDSARALLVSCDNTLLNLQNAHRKTVNEMEQIARDAAGLNDDPWYRAPAFWFGLGLAGGAGLVIWATSM